MIFDLSRDYVPDSYKNSRDYRVVLKQLSLLLTVLKYNIDHFTDLYSADNCPEHLLPLLAKMVGYEYNYDKSVESNRKIIKSFPQLIRNRGSELGMRLAVALSVHTSPGSHAPFMIDESSLIIETDVESGLILVYYPNVEVLDWSLLEVVRPVGMRIKLIKTDIGSSAEELDLKITARAIQRDKYHDNSVVDESHVSYDIT